MNEIKYLDLKEFRDFGFLQEVNRQFFHPLVLALALCYLDNGDVVLSGILDYREDPEGMVFDVDMLDSNKAANVAALLESKRDVRTSKLGNIIQPL